MVTLLYADEAGDDQPYPIGTFLGGGGLCASNNNGGGYPSWVKTTGALAVVSTIGVGLQVADLSQVQGNNARFVTSQVGSWNYNGGKNNRDISSATRGLAILPGVNPTVICSINGFGMGLWALSNTGTLVQMGNGVE